MRTHTHTHTHTNTHTHTHKHTHTQTHTHTHKHTYTQTHTNTHTKREREAQSEKSYNLQTAAEENRNSPAVTVNSAPLGYRLSLSKFGRLPSQIGVRTTAVGYVDEHVVSVDTGVREAGGRYVLLVMSSSDPHSHLQTDGEGHRERRGGREREIEIDRHVDLRVI